jgi:hypothetical protein
MRIRRILTLLMMLFAAGCGAAEPAATFAPTTSPAPKLVPANTLVPIPEPTKTAVREPAVTLSVIQVVDDFESPKTDWIAGMEPEYADSSSTSAVLTVDHATQGSQALLLSFDKNDKPKAIFYVDRVLDFSKAKALQFDIFNAANVDGVGVSFTTGPDALWQESVILPVRAAKTTTLTIDLTAADFKTAATNWEFTASLAGLNQVTRLAIIVYPSATGSVYLDNIVLLGD